MTYEEIKERQNWLLYQKIDHTAGAVERFYNTLGGKVYVSFSGGKDSTVLLDICRRFVNKDIKGVFCNTGNEYPEIIKFVSQTDNVTVVRPDIRIKQVIEKYGFPLISKEQAQYIHTAKYTKSEKIRKLKLEGDSSKRWKIAEKWKFLINAPFDVSDKCCEYLKKKNL